MQFDRKITILDIQEKKKNLQPITMLTAYDYPGALLVDEAGVDLILVGDSLAMTVLGYPNTVSVTMAEMLHHCKAVSRGTKRAFLVGDMPFLSYQISALKAAQNAGRFIKEGNMDAIKLEGGCEVLKSIKAICQAGIPVMGHLGLTPQTATKLGGYRVQAITAAGAKKLYDEALSLEDAGCFSIVLEAVPAPVARIVSQKLMIPTIGIGAGNECNGQVLVFHDILGLFDQFKPKFVKHFANLKPLILEAIKNYCQEVEARTFPSQEHTYKIDQIEFDKFLAGLK